MDIFMIAQEHLYWFDIKPGNAVLDHLKGIMHVSNAQTSLSGWAAL
jgi:hypothetical protein